MMISIVAMVMYNKFRNVCVRRNTEGIKQKKKLLYGCAGIKANGSKNKKLWAGIIITGLHALILFFTVHYGHMFL